MATSPFQNLYIAATAHVCNIVNKHTGDTWHLWRNGGYGRITLLKTESLLYKLVFWNMSESEDPEKYHWKGKFVTNKVRKRMKQRSECGRMRKDTIKKVQIDSDATCCVKGNRIVDLEYLSKNMNCTGCHARLYLNLKYIERETIYGAALGAASIFNVRCHECLLVNTLKIGKEYAKLVSGKSTFSINMKIGTGSQLRNEEANIEGEMYSRGIDLLDRDSNSESTCVEVLIGESIVWQTDDLAILFFDLETSGLSLMHDEILQVCVKFGNQIFKSFITPTQAINYAASKSNGLTNVREKLYQHDFEVATLPKKQVFIKLLEFLQKLNKKCLLVAHNCSFDSSRLILTVKNLNLLEGYEQVIDGFSDSLSLFRKKYPKRESGYKLTTLATELLSLSVDGAHDASFDVNLLEKLSTTFLDINDVVKNKKSVADVICSLDNSENTQKLLPSFKPMDGIISTAMQKRLCSSGIDYQEILFTYMIEGEEEAKKLLQGFINGKATIIKSKKILEKILEFLECVCK